MDTLRIIKKQVKLQYDYKRITHLIAYIIGIPENHFGIYIPLPLKHSTEDRITIILISLR